MANWTIEEGSVSICLLEISEDDLESCVTETIIKEILSGREKGKYSILQRFLMFKRVDEMLLRVDHVNMNYGSNVILRDVQAVVNHLEFIDEPPRGQVVCFLGPSGIGKTQMSRIVAGLQIPTSGHVATRGEHNVTHGSVGMVPQNYPIFDYTTVAKNLRIAGKQAGLSDHDLNEKATELIREFSLEEHLAKYPRDLSGGTKQRVAIVQQLMCATNYMVMDEPFSGLDPIMKQKASEAIVKLASLNTYNVIIVVTHDITQGLSVADTVWMMGYEMGPNGFIPGARIVESYDLAIMGLAWKPEIHQDSEFLKFVGDVRKRFQTLR